MPATTITAEDARRAARNASAIAAASLLSKGALFIWQLILARGLGDTDYGIYGTVGAFIAVGSALVSFGMGPIMIRDIARTPQKAGQYLSATFILQTLLGLLAYGLVNGAAALGGYSAVLQGFLILAGSSLIIDVLGNMTNDILLAQERMLISSVISVGHVAILIILAGLALGAGYGLMGVYTVTIFSGGLRAGAMWLAVLRSGVRPAWPLDHTVMRSLLINGAPLALSSFLALAYQHTDKLITTRFIGEAQTGYITAGFVIVFGVIEMLSTTILTALYPMMSRYQDDAFRFIVEKLALFTLIISLPLALVVSIYATEITVPLFGVDFLPTADIIRILIWYTAIAMTANIFAQALIVRNQQRVLLLIRAGGLVTNISLTLLLIPSLGIIGAAVSSCIAEMGVLMLMVRRFPQLDWPALIPRVLRLIAVTLASGAIMLITGRIHPILGVIAGITAYLPGLVLVLRTDDWDLLYRLVAALPGGHLIRRVWQRDTQINW